MTVVERLRAALADRYEVRGEIGHGGMARVYQARDLRHAREVAIKVLHPELAAALGADRFHHEIRIAAGLVHPNIVPLLDSGEAAGLLYFVMPFVPGETLRARIQRERQLPLAEAVTIAAQAAAALEYAHRQGVIHRDIKPENILLLEGQAVVADFGVARAIDTAGGDRVTSSGFVVGTPAYMSPEQAAADPSLDGRSDEYSLGCVAYEMLAGRPPFVGPTAQAITALRLTTTPPPVRELREGVPEEVDRAIARALMRVPADRHGGPGAFATALHAAATAVTPAPAAATAARHPGTRPTGRRRWILLVAAALATALVLFLLRRSPPSPAAARDAGVVAVVPFTPASPDTALERLGRDLAVTVSQALDGVGGLRAVDPQTVIGRWAATAGPRGGEAAQALGTELGAGSVLHGSLVRIGREVQADLTLVAPDSSGALAHVTLMAPPDSIVRLTDSIARGVLAQLFRRGPPPSPSLDAAFRTTSLAALRAFLEGEQAFAQSRFDVAAAAYTRATEADSTFWLAWARLGYALDWSWRPDEADAARRRASPHRSELPPRDRLLLESGLLDNVAATLDSAAMATERFPDSWLAWFVYGDHLIHFGSLVGRSVSDAQVAMGRALALNPSLVPAWEHFVWTALILRDAEGVARGVAALDRLGAGTLIAQGYGGDQLLQFRLQLAMLREDARARDSLRPLVVRDLAGSRTPVFSARFLHRHGWPADQTRLSSELLAQGVPVGAEAYHAEARFHSLLMRGAWDSGGRILAGGLPGVQRSYSEWLRYPLASVAAWLGLVPPESAAAHRAASAAAAADPEAAADLTFRDGLVALARTDAAGVARARRELADGPDTHAGTLARSLELLGRIAAGDRTAGPELAELEEARARRPGESESRHPLLTVVNRLAAARALTAQGQAVRALGLLEFADARYGGSPGIQLAVTALPFAEFERARAAEALGEAAGARRHYAEFLRLCDLCPEGVGEMVDEARRKVGRER